MADIFSHYQDILDLDKPRFLDLLEYHINLDEIVPASFRQHFCDDLQAVFDRLVDLTEPICRQIDPHKATMSLFDSTGIEVFVKENNPKFLNAMIRGLKAFAKAKGLDDSYDPYKAACSRMPSHAEVEPQAKYQYVNGHFCYAIKAGIPCCPNDPALPMKPEGNTSHLRCGIPTFKFVCPQMTWDKGEDGKYHRTCHCENPCTPSKSGRMVYIYPERDLRMYPGAIRDTDEWDQTYKIRGSIERIIHHFKESCCLDGRRSRNPKRLYADLLLCGITQLLTVLLADSLHHLRHIRSLKKLIA